MKGSCETLSNCWRAASSKGTPLVHALMGTPFSVLITLYVCSVMVLLSSIVPHCDGSVLVHLFGRSALPARVVLRCQRKIESSASLQNRKFRFGSGDGSAREGG